MSYNPVPLVVTGDTWSASQHNTYLKDNLAAIWAGTTLGDMEYYASGSTKTRIPIGATGRILAVVGGVPAWKELYNPIVLTNPVTNTSYDGDPLNIGTYSMTPNTFNSNIPTGVKAIFVNISVQWAGASSANYAAIRPKGIGTTCGVIVRAYVGGIGIENAGLVPLDNSGQFDITIGGANAAAFLMYINGYVGI